LSKNFIKDYYIPFVHLSAVLLQIYKKTERPNGNHTSRIRIGQPKVVPLLCSKTYDRDSYFLKDREERGHESQLTASPITASLGEQ